MRFSETYFKVFDRMNEYLKNVNDSEGMFFLIYVDIIFI